MSTELFYAALRGDPARAESAITAGAIVDEKRYNCWHIFEVMFRPEFTASEQHFILFSKLLEKTDADPLIGRKGNLQITRVLVAAGADINAADDVGISPLMAAVSGGEARSSIGRHESGTAAAPGLPVEPCFAEIAGILLEHGADVNSAANEKDWAHRGLTALHYAAGRGDTETARALLNAGARVNASAYNSGTPLARAVQSGNREVAELLHSYGADADAANDNGSTPLMQAAATGNVELATLLLDWGTDLHARTTERGEDALFFAARADKTDIIALLIAHGADVNSRSNSGATPLIHAAHQGCADAAATLLAAGADIHVRSSKGLTALGAAQAQTVNTKMFEKQTELRASIEDRVRESLEEADAHLRENKLNMDAKHRNELETTVRSALEETLGKFHSMLSQKAEREHAGRVTVTKLLKAAGATE